MEPDALLASLRADRSRLAQLADADLTATVPSCPDWDVRQLLIHLGRIHRWAIDSAQLPPGADFPRLGPRPSDDTPLVEWLTDGLDELLDFLATTDLDAPCWSFTGPTTRRFWLRRQTHETSIHRWDAQAAGGEPEPVDGEIAVDGVDEWLEIESGRWYKGRPGVTGTVHLHATDGDGEWHLDFDPLPPPLAARSPQGRCGGQGLAIRPRAPGVASTVDPTEVEVLGDTRSGRRVPRPDPGLLRWPIGRGTEAAGRSARSGEAGGVEVLTGGDPRTATPGDDRSRPRRSPGACHGDRSEPARRRTWSRTGPRCPPAASPAPRSAAARPGTR